MDRYSSMMIIFLPSGRIKMARPSCNKYRFPIANSILMDACRVLFARRRGSVRARGVILDAWNQTSTGSETCRATFYSHLRARHGESIGEGKNEKKIRQVCICSFDEGSRGSSERRVWQMV